MVVSDFFGAGHKRRRHTLEIRYKNRSQNKTICASLPKHYVMLRYLSFFLIFWVVSPVFSQTLEDKAAQVKTELQQIEDQKKKALRKLEAIKFDMIRRDLEQLGLPAILPGNQLVFHSALALEYSENHEQARWVAHIITPDVLVGQVTRSNDFRVDSSITSGSAEEADYFLKYAQADGSFKYDGFGYDRGHLAPSADFRWSQIALSESYLYSNMSPQKAEFNRGAWGQLEDRIRGYLYRHPETQLYVVTGPVLQEGLPVIERGTNKVSIPKYYWKVALDLKNRKAIGFLMPNQTITYPLATFSVPINRIEAETGLDFFNKLPDDLEELLESQNDNKDWLPEIAAGDVEPVYPPSLPPNHFNTVQAKNLAGQNQSCWVCGTVVSARISRSGNVLLNLDKQFPNQVFTVFIRKEHIPNFPFNPDQELKGRVICARGRVIDQDGTPGMFIEGENDLEFRD